MRKRQFGRTGWSVSEIGFGTWPIGSAWGPVEDSELLDALRISLDEGVDFLDTADVYGDHTSERLIAGILKERKKQGKSVPIVATKIGRSRCRSKTPRWSPTPTLRHSSRIASRRLRSMRLTSCSCTARQSKPTTDRKRLRRWIVFSGKARFASMG